MSQLISANLPQLISADLFQLMSPQGFGGIWGNINVMTFERNFCSCVELFLLWEVWEEQSRFFHLLRHLLAPSQADTAVPFGTFISYMQSSFQLSRFLRNRGHKFPWHQFSAGQVSADPKSWATAFSVKWEGESWGRQGPPTWFPRENSQFIKLSSFNALVLSAQPSHHSLLLRWCLPSLLLWESPHHHIHSCCSSP